MQADGCCVLESLSRYMKSKVVVSMAKLCHGSFRDLINCWYGRRKSFLTLCFKERVLPHQIVAAPLLKVRYQMQSELRYLHADFRNRSGLPQAAFPKWPHRV